MKTCSACGARSPDGATWCTQCYVHFEVDPEPQPESLVDPFADPDAMPEAPNFEHSRWAASEITMGPFGRIATSLLLLLPLVFLFSAGVMGLVGTVMWLFIIMPAALRSIWKKTRVTN